MVEVGQMSKADLSQLTAQRASSEYTLVESETMLANYKLQLKQLLEITDMADFDVAIPATTDEQALADIPAMLTVYQAALTQRPEIQSAQLGVESSNLQCQGRRTAYRKYDWWRGNIDE